MQCNVILAGVGGQGILTIAHLISATAMRRGWVVKQAETHGMSQRGGAVQSHVRFADHQLYSDLIPRGDADVILSGEPLEALRYLDYLGDCGAIVTAGNPQPNIAGYPPVEELLAQISRFGDHVVVDAEGLARKCGSRRAASMVLLGAVSIRLAFDPEELEQVLVRRFAELGKEAVRVNRLAFRYGRAAAIAYSEGLRRGASPAALRDWLAGLPPEELIAGPLRGPEWLSASPPNGELSAAQDSAIQQMLGQVARENRTVIYEHEVYALVQAAGAINAPRHVVVPPGDSLGSADLALFRGDRVVLKIISPDVVHKTEAAGLRFVRKDLGVVNREIEQLVRSHSVGTRVVAGVLVVEFVDHRFCGLGGELFVGIRATAEFGPIVAAGLGGVDTEYLAAKMRPGIAVAKCPALDTSAGEFFTHFQQTAAYEVLAGKVRGHERVVSNGELLRCFAAFLALARRYGAARSDGSPSITELEVNPFAFVRQRMIPLDGRGRLGKVQPTAAPRPLQKVEALFEPRSIAVIGVSERRENFGRLILGNIKDCGFPPEHLYVIKPGRARIDGVRCVGDLEQLPEDLDLLVVATAAGDVPEIISRAAARDVRAVIVIPGALGEKKGTTGRLQAVQRMIQAARRRPGGGPLLLGGNSLGVLSRPGRYDTFFIPPDKLLTDRSRRPQKLALISQSGAFMITRMSNLPSLDPMFAVSIGNQADLTVSDVLNGLCGRPDVDCLALYVEGFRLLDGLATIRAIKRATGLGKTVLFYKAGRTPAGRSATQGHTACVAGDYDVCQSAAAVAGAIVIDTFKEFEQLLELSTCLQGKQVQGKRVGVVSNAGFEAVGAGDTMLGARYRLQVPDLLAETRSKLVQVLQDHRLQDLVNADNPLDLTPMATDQTYLDAVRVMIEAPEIDSLVVSVVPLTGRLRTTPREVSHRRSLAQQLPCILQASHKPAIFIVDSGPLYDALAYAIREAGIPVFRSCDQAIRSLGRYLCHRCRISTR